MVNFHVHSSNSEDCKYSMDEMCAAAISAGITHLCFTDHYDVNYKGRPEYNIEGAVSDFRNVKEKYSDKIKLYLGIELGQPSENKDEAKALLTDSRIDFVLGSVHNLPAMEDFYFIDYSTVNIDSLLSAYFSELTKMCENFAVDSVAHIGYPLRYISRTGCRFDLTPHHDEIERLLRVMAKKDISLEINSSDVTRELHSTIPPQSVIDRFKALKGNSITVGSDAHKPEKISLGLDAAYDAARKAGFDSISVYEKRCRHQIKL